MTSALGVHFIPAHSRQEDWQYIQDINPGSVKLMNPDPDTVSRVMQRAPHSLYVLRDHPMSEEKTAMAADPVDLGIRQGAEWRRKVDEMRDGAYTRGIPFPSDDKLIVLGINEPKVWTDLPQVVAYNVAFIESCRKHGLTPGALNLSVGWPANTGPDTPPNWEPYEPMHRALVANKGYLLVHEYWDLKGPEENWGWWAGRILKCPWRDVPIIIGECGVDRGVAGATWEGGRGWHGHIDANVMADELLRYVNRLKAEGLTNLHSIQPFTTDYGSRDWRTFDTQPAAHELSAMNQSMPEVDVRFDGPAIPVDPPTVTPPVTPMPPLPPISGGPVSWPAKGILTQRFAENYEIYLAKFGSAGHNGIDIASNVPVPVVSYASGVVAWVGVDASYGKYVRVYHEALNIHTFYAHLESVAVTQGMSVGTEQQLGVMGNTGYSTGRHLHFEVRLGAGAGGYAQGAFGHTKGRIDPELYVYLTT